LNKFFNQILTIFIMQNKSNNFRGGIKFLDLSLEKSTLLGAAESKLTIDDLGPLKELAGTWKGQPNHGWNIISIPAKGGFKFEVIPYSEDLKFNPKILVGAGNVGPVLNDVEHNQTLVGLMYEQIIKSSCKPISPKPKERKLKNGGIIPANFERKCKLGFEYGNIIHAETGFFLNIQDYNSNLNLTRLSTIPHGNSVLQLGKSTTTDQPITNSDFIGAASPRPTVLDGRSVEGLIGYGDVIDQRRTPFPDFPKFDITDPNSALHNGLEGKTILEMTTLEFSTEYDKAGILNIPFLQHNVEATKMTAIFWIQKIQGDSKSKHKNEQADYWQLQYTQTIDLVFPIPSDPAPIIWPHITVNTLRRVSEPKK
jgi:hypothetical protein